MWKRSLSSAKLLGDLDLEKFPDPFGSSLCSAGRERLSTAAHTSSPRGSASDPQTIHTAPRAPAARERVPGAVRAGRRAAVRAARRRGAPGRAGEEAASRRQAPLPEPLRWRGPCVPARFGASFAVRTFTAARTARPSP